MFIIHISGTEIQGTKQKNMYISIQIWQIDYKDMYILHVLKIILYH